MEKVSVIVPIYNVEDYLEDCLNSIINQTYKNLEIILINDGSKDNSKNICDCYAKKDMRIKVIHQENGGLSIARNEGIKKASGDYLTFIDSDDYIELNMIEKLVKALKKDDADLSICNRKEYFDYKNHYKYTFKNDKKYLLLDKISALKELCSFNLFDMSAWAKLYKKNLFKDILFPEDKLSEDYYIMYILFAKCEKISYINDYLYIYRQRRGSISKNKKINYDYKLAAEEQMKYLNKNYPKLKIYANSAYALANMTIFNWYITNRRMVPKSKEYKELKLNVKLYIGDIKNNEKLSKSRKFQAKIFIINRYLYAIFYFIYRKLK